VGVGVERGEGAAFIPLASRGSVSIIFMIFLRVTSIGSLGGSALGNQAKGVLFHPMVRSRLGHMVRGGGDAIQRQKH